MFFIKSLCNFAGFLEDEMMSKKVVTFLCAMLLCLSVFGQGKVSTRKYILNDFSDKITQVVLSGNEVLDSGLRQEIVNYWTLSPYEFCTQEEFEERKTQDLYYFLIPAESRFKGEEDPGVLFLTLVKGGETAAEGIQEMHEIISIPLMAAAGGSGRELVYLGPIIQAIQEFTQDAMQSEKTAYSMDHWFNRYYLKEGKMKQIYLAEDDLSEKVTEKDRQRYLDEDIHLCSDEEADEVFLKGRYHTLVSYTVAPFLPENKASYCYKMLFDAESHRLFYFHKHKITEKTGVGFLAADLKRLALSR
jgi:hypothetical protein